MIRTGMERNEGVEKEASRKGRSLSDSTTSAAPADAADPTYVVRSRIQRRVGAAEGKNKVGVSRPRYVRACTTKRDTQA